MILWKRASHSWISMAMASDDVGEPFIDLDGSKAYTPPGDQLWQCDCQRQIGEPITFDYTNGHAEPIHAAVANGVRCHDPRRRSQFGIAGPATLRPASVLPDAAPGGRELHRSVGRKRSATHDVGCHGKNETHERELRHLAAAEADFVVKRKLTCKMIAQWAINVVDVRDSDAIMTPFEYDENPWDGWGVWDDRWVGENSNAGFITKKGDPFNATNPATFLPLDGDPATDENNGVIIDWASDASANGGPKVLKQLGFQGQQINAYALGAANPPIITYPLDQTRGVVWGAERPELLITETLAYHDRRTEDEMSADLDGHDNFANSKQTNSSSTRYKDYDLDQGLRPRGSLFIELRNPWSQDGQLPRSLYSKVDSTIDGRTNIQLSAVAGRGAGTAEQLRGNVDEHRP